LRGLRKERLLQGDRPEARQRRQSQAVREVRDEGKEISLKPAVPPRRPRWPRRGRRYVAESSHSRCHREPPRYAPSMQAKLLLTLILTALTPGLLGAASLPVVMRDGREHVTAAALEREAGIVIKRLPGRGGYVACGAEQCAPVKSVATDADTVLVPVNGLSEALNLTPNFDEQRRHVTFVPARSTTAS